MSLLFACGGEASDGTHNEGPPCAPAELCRADMAEWPVPGSRPEGAAIGFSYAGLADEDNETFVDEVTKLEWDRYVALEDYTWAQADRRCEELVLHGHDDWRLPTYLELTTLIDPDQKVQMQSEDRFGSVLALRLYWSSTRFAPTEWLPDPEEKYFMVLADGLALEQPPVEQASVRCVRWLGPPRASTPRYETSGSAAEPTVRDTRTRLTWQREVPELPTGCSGPELGIAGLGACTQPEAEQYCEQLSYGGHDDWRLPTLNEVVTLYDLTAPDRIDTRAFPTRRSEMLWTGSQSADDPGDFFGTLATGGFLATEPTATRRNVRCVR